MTFQTKKSILVVGGLLCIGFFFIQCSLVIPEEITQEIESLPDVVDFNYHIKPLLSDRCFKCHGPDENT